MEGIFSLHTGKQFDKSSFDKLVQLLELLLASFNNASDFIKYFGYPFLLID